jgi:hypothetical protein
VSLELLSFSLFLGFLEFWRTKRMQLHAQVRVEVYFFGFPHGFSISAASQDPLITTN